MIRRLGLYALLVVILIGVGAYLAHRHGLSARAAEREALIARVAEAEGLARAETRRRVTESEIHDRVLRGRADAMKKAGARLDQVVRIRASGAPVILPAPQPTVTAGGQPAAMACTARGPDGSCRSWRAACPPGGNVDVACPEPRLRPHLDLEFARWRSDGGQVYADFEGTIEIEDLASGARATSPLQKAVPVTGIPAPLEVVTEAPEVRRWRWGLDVGLGGSTDGVGAEICGRAYRASRLPLIGAQPGAYGCARGQTDGDVGASAGLSLLW